MRIYEDITLTPFGGVTFWSGAAETVKHLTADQLAELEAFLEAGYPEGISKTELNDIFWFETDQLAEWLGFADWEALLAAEEKEEQ